MAHLGPKKGPFWTPLQEPKWPKTGLFYVTSGRIWAQKGVQKGALFGPPFWAQNDPFLGPFWAPKVAVFVHKTGGQNEGPFWAHFGPLGPNMTY